MLISPGQETTIKQKKNLKQRKKKEKVQKVILKQIKIVDNFSQ